MSLLQNMQKLIRGGDGVAVVAMVGKTDRDGNRWSEEALKALADKNANMTFMDGVLYLHIGDNHRQHIHSRVGAPGRPSK